jgi:transposase
MWSKKGKQPIILTHNKLYKSSYVGIVSPHNGKLFTKKLEHFTYETILDSLREYNKLNNDENVFLVYDNAPWHKKAVRLAKEMEEFRNIHFIALPPYSPDLNPIERVWRQTRYHKTHNRYFSNIEEVSEAVEEYFNHHAQENSDFKRLCNF